MQQQPLQTDAFVRTHGETHCSRFAQQLTPVLPSSKVQIPLLKMQEFPDGRSFLRQGTTLPPSGRNSGGCARFPTSTGTGPGRPGRRVSGAEMPTVQSLMPRPSCPAPSCPAPRDPPLLSHCGTAGGWHPGPCAPRGALSGLGGWGGTSRDDSPPPPAPD